MYPGSLVNAFLESLEKGSQNNLLISCLPFYNIPKQINQSQIYFSLFCCQLKLLNLIFFLPFSTNSFSINKISCLASIFSLSPYLLTPCSLGSVVTPLLNQLSTFYFPNLLVFSLSSFSRKVMKPRNQEIKKPSCLLGTLPMDSRVLHSLCCPSFSLLCQILIFFLLL